MPLRPTHTFSIVARDKATGALGVAVQTHWFAVGSLVPWVRAGVGAVATQSFVNPAWGPQGLDLLAAGKPPKEALETLIAADEGQALRQAGIVAASGEAYAHTGERCIAQAGHHHGTDFSVQANMMKNSAVVPSMVDAWEKSAGKPLPERLIEVLRGGQAAGGDIRGRQSAALLVAPPQPTGKAWERYEVDLRVDDHPEPIEELARLLVTHRAYEHMNEADVALERKDFDAALGHYTTATELLPENQEIQFWHGLVLAQSGDDLRGMAKLRMLYTRNPDWLELTRRLGDARVLDQDTLARILTMAAP